MKNILKFLSLFIIIIATFFTCVACDDSYISDDGENNDNSYTLDYTNAEMLEEALNSGVSANGKYICFQVTEYHPESFYGYNCWAGEHLNCISENDVNAVEGDYIIGRITEEPYSSFGSWKIYYKFIELKKNFDDPNKEDENLQLKENEVKTPNSASYYYGKNYKDVINELQNAGFNNIKTEVLYDVVLGLFTTAEDVETVSINGKTDFKKNAIFEKDAQIVVTYHDWWDNEPNEDDLEIMDENGIYAPISSKDAKGLSYENVKNQFINAGFTNVKYSNVTGYDREESIDSVLYIEINYSQEYKTNLKLKKDVKVVIYKYIGTYNEDNCEDLVELLNVKDPGGDIVESFANKYDNEYIEFDGCVRAINKTDGYNTRYDVLFGAKDFDMNHAWGPNFKLICVYLGGETYKVGQNIHMVARVDKYDKIREWFIIDLVHIEKRTVNNEQQKPDNENDINNVGRAQLLNYELNEDKNSYKVIELIRLSNTNLDIPDTHNGKPVTIIGSGAFYGKNNFNTVNIGKNIVEIEDSAFNSCDLLESVVFDNDSKLQTIGKYSFAYCDELKDFVFPDSVIKINESVFLHSSKIKYNVKDKLKYYESKTNPYFYLAGSTISEMDNACVDENCKFIGARAFYFQKKLTKIHIPDRVIGICYQAFYDSALKNISLPKNLKHIGYNALHSTSGVEKVYFRGSINDWVQIDFDGGTLSYKTEFYIDNILVTSININTATKINPSAFIGYSKLSSVTIGSTVKSIGDFAFYECDNLSDIVINEGVEFIGNSAFEKCVSLNNMVLPSSVNSLGINVFSGCNLLNSITFNDILSWYVTDYGGYWEEKTNGVLIDVSNANNNAKKFKQDYNNYFWYKK